MFYDGTNPTLQMVGTGHLKWKGYTYDVPRRPYSVISFRISGETKVTAKGKICTVSAGDLLYIPQNVDYTAEYTETETIIVHFVTRQDDDEIKVFHLKNPDKVHRLFEKANSVWQEKDTGYYLRTFSLLYEIFGEILKNETDIVLPRKILDAVTYINENFRDNNLGVEEVCNHAKISQSTFRALFKTHYQKTPTDYITELRLEYARCLIAEGMSVENAAYESGFNDPKYFARTVKKRLGCTPRDLKTYGK